MGYTHYWTFTNEQAASTEKFAEALKAIGALVNYARSVEGFKLGDGFGEAEPEITDEKVWFNGLGDESFETCGFKMHDTGYGGYNFTKTGRRPYDPVVVASIIILKAILGDDVHIASDGICQWSHPDTGQPSADFEIAEGVTLAYQFIQSYSEKIFEGDLFDLCQKVLHWMMIDTKHPYPEITSTMQDAMINAFKVYHSDLVNEG